MPGRRTPAQDTELVVKAIETFDETFASLPLAGKLAHISGMVGNVPKNGFNRAQNYKFVQETDLVAAIRPYLAAAGILLTYDVLSHELVDIGETRSGGRNRLTILTIGYSFSDGKEELTGTTMGYGADTSDKGVYKAMTGGLKYVLMKVFQVDTGDDPERDGRAPRAREAAAPTDSYVDDSYGSYSYEHDEMPTVVSTARPTTARGGHQSTTTATQYNAIVKAMLDLSMDQATAFGVFEKSIGRKPAEGGQTTKDWLYALSSEEAGAIAAELADMSQTKIEETVS